MLVTITSHTSTGANITALSIYRTTAGFFFVFFFLCSRSVWLIKLELAFAIRSSGHLARVFAHLPTEQCGWQNHPGLLHVWRCA